MGVTMNLEIGEVLSRAWQITWKHKVLWIISIVMGLFTSILFPLMVSPLLFPILMQNSRMHGSAVLVVMIGLVIAVALFFLTLYPISVLVQTSITLGVLNANEDKPENLSSRDL